jgi:hypothetical protein
VFVLRRHYRDKKVVGVFVRFRAPLHFIKIGGIIHISKPLFLVIPATVSKVGELLFST